MPDNEFAAGISPALFDTRGEFARDLPLDLIAAWRTADQDPAAARSLLRPYLATGTVVVSDSAGLTHLALCREPLEVMALINRPKELVYEYGAAIGGRGLGVWAADNTEMFYPEEVPCDRIASMLLAVQDRIRAECEVQIGLAAHYGSFYLVGNSVYGPEAVAIETMAEDRTVGGEIVFTATAWERVQGAGPDCQAAFQALARCEAPGDPVDGYRVLDGPRPAAWNPTQPAPDYPLPFSAAFHTCLQEFYQHQNVELLRQQVYENFARTCTVLLTEREAISSDVAAIEILMEMERSAVAGTLGALLLGAGSGTEVKTAGSLSIYLFETTYDAWIFADRLRHNLQAEGIRTRSAIATGEVLLFDLEAGGKDISGVPVNMASKAAQDLGTFGNIYVLSQESPAADRLQPVSMHIGGADRLVYVSEHTS